MIKPLSLRINRTHPLPVRFYAPGYVDVPKNDWAVWLSIEEASPLYLVPEMQWLSLRESREKTETYLASASKLIHGLEGGWLDREERELILEALGEPPLPSLPIYLITCSDGASEDLVYVGKTKTVSRFNGGHSAALKLLAPKYDNKRKKIYRSTICFHNDDEYISLDWVQPEKLALELLDSVESHLIYYFQPELNKDKRKTPLAKWDFNIHIQNFLEGGFLNDKFI